MPEQDARPGDAGFTFTEQGLKELAEREQREALAAALEAGLQTTAQALATPPRTDQPAHADDGPETHQPELATGLSELTAELENRLADADNNAHQTDRTNQTDPSDLSSAADSPAATIPPEPPARRLPPPPEGGLQSITLQYTGLFADPDSDSDSVLRIETPADACRILEGFLSVTAEPLSLARLSKLTGLAPECIEPLLSCLSAELDKRNGALKLAQLAGGFQLATRDDLSEWMARLQKHRRRPTLSNPALETLAIIAYRQPITRGEIEAIRGVDSSAPLRALQDLELVEIGGRKEAVGRPALYVTTPAFLKTFNLMSLDDLPPLAELKKEGKSPQNI